MNFKFKKILFRRFVGQAGIRHPASVSGFTLMEILMSLAIFGTAIVIIANIFVLAGRAQQKTSVIERVQSDARFSMETMAREIHLGKIDYDFYNNNLKEPENTLALRDVNGEQIIFYANNCEGDISRQCLKINIGGNIADLTTKDAEVVDLKFYIKPLSNPFMSRPQNIGDCLGDFDKNNSTCLCQKTPLDSANCYSGQSCIDTGKDDAVGNNILICKNADVQPRVTAVLAIKGIGDKKIKQKIISLQTTVSTKNYER